MTVMSLDEIKKMSPLTEEEKSIIRKANPQPTDDCPEMSADELAQFRPWYDKEKRMVTINMDVNSMNYFRRLSLETGVSSEELIQMFLAQCAKEEKKPIFA